MRLSGSVIVGKNRCASLGESLRAYAPQFNRLMGSIVVEEARKELYPGHGYRTGALHNSIRWEKVGPMSGFVYSDVPYAPHIEFGTSMHPAIPFLRPGIARGVPLAMDEFVSVFGQLALAA